MTTTISWISIDNTFARVNRKPFNSKTRDKTLQIDKSFINLFDKLRARSVQLRKKNVQIIS